MPTKEQVRDALASAPHENPTRSQVVRDWIAARVAADPHMRAAAANRADAEQES